jgi:putative oxidoreductase
MGTAMSLTDVTLLVLRLVVGGTFAAHGAQKAFGWWNGTGYAKWTQVMVSMRMHPAPLWAFISVGAELGAGLALALGFLTPFAAMVLIGQSVFIIIKAHLPKGFFSATGGIEFPLGLAAGLVAILGVGPGELAIDNAIRFPAFSDPFRLLLLAIGIAGGLVAISISRLHPAPQPAASTQ